VEKYIKKVTIRTLFILLSVSTVSLTYSAIEKEQQVLRRAIDSGNVYVVDAILSQAISSGNIDGNVDEVKELLAGEDLPDSFRERALFVALDSHTPTTEMVKFLLQRGALVDARNVSGETPLIMFAELAENHPEIVELLLANGADPHAKDDQGKTALDVARRYNRVGVVKVIEDFIAQRRAEISQAILKARPEVYPAITEEIAEFEIGK